MTEVSNLLLEDAEILFMLSVELNTDSSSLEVRIDFWLDYMVYRLKLYMLFTKNFSRVFLFFQIVTNQ